MRRKLMAMHSQIVAFEDQLVKSICVEKFGGVDGITDRQYGTAGVKGYDGECTYRQLDAVKNIRPRVLRQGNREVQRVQAFYFVYQDRKFRVCKRK